MWKVVAGGQKNKQHSHLNKTFQHTVSTYYFCKATSIFTNLVFFIVTNCSYYRSQGSGATWCPGIFKKKKKSADRPVTAPFDLRTDIHRPQTAPFFGLVQYPPPESSYRLLYRGSNATAHLLHHPMLHHVIGLLHRRHH